MKYTVSMHIGNAHNQKHNTREMSNNTQIRQERSEENLILRNEPEAVAYHRLFDAAKLEYNQRCKKQGHAERCIKDYRQHVLRNNKFTAKEMVVQIGNAKEQPDEKTAVKALQDVYKAFTERYGGSFEVIGAYIHLDEATPHMHVTFIPVIESKRGMHRQVSMNKACKVFANDLQE